MSLTYFFSFRSPYSWIASKLLQPVLTGGQGLDLVPFWEPDEHSDRLLRERGGSFPYQVMSEAKHRYILQDVRRLARSLQFEMRWPIDRNPWWDLSHLTYLKAEQLGCAMPYFWGIYRARWEQGRDISDPRVIAALCEELNLDARAITAAPQDPAIRARGAECLYRIYRDDIFGVPFFLFGRERFWGVDRIPLLLRRLAGTLAMGDRETAVVPDFVYDFDHAGGCG